MLHTITHIETELSLRMMSPSCQVIGDSIAFSLGLATTLALLGVGASFAGKAYGQIGQGLPLGASGLAVIMGLNLLEVVKQFLFHNFKF